MRGRGARRMVGRPACGAVATARRGRRWWQGGTRRGGGTRWGRGQATGPRAGRYARVQVVRAVVVACDRAGDPSMWVGTRGSGPGAHGRGRRWGEGRAWVVGGTCILVGLCQHVHGVVVGDGRHHPCDAHVTCRRLCHWRQGRGVVIDGVGARGGVAVGQGRERGRGHEEVPVGRITSGRPDGTGVGPGGDPRWPVCCRARGWVRTLEGGAWSTRLGTMRRGFALEKKGRRNTMRGGVALEEKAAAAHRVEGRVAP